MKIFYIAFNIVQRNIRDRKTLTVSLLLPIVLILILGSALKDAYSTKDIGKVSVCYVNKDSGSISKNFDNFLKFKQIKEIIDVEKVNSYEEAVKLVDSGKVKELIYIDKNYSNEVEKGNKGNIQIYASKNSGVSLSIVQSVIDSYNNAANTIMTTSKIARQNTQYIENNNIKENYLSVEGKTPRAIDYYAVTMLVLTLMYSANYGCSELEDMFFKNIGKRLKTTAVKGYELIFGIILGTISTLILQATVLILFTKFAYGANWGSDPATICLTVLALSILSIAIGVMVTTLVGDSKRASTLLGIIIPIFTFVSGGYVKLDIQNQIFINIKHYIPNNLAHTAFFNTIYNESVVEVQQSIALMFIFAAVMFSIAVISGRRKAE